MLSSNDFGFVVAGIQETVKLVQAAGGTCYGYVCDLCDRDDIYKKAKIIREEIGKVINSLSRRYFTGRSYISCWMRNCK